MVPHSFGTGWYRETRAPAARLPPMESAVTHDDLTHAHVHVAIIGSGFSGLGTAIRLKQEGMNDFIVLERASEVGGTWRDNTYPGCACDVPSHLYSFSFAPNPDWSRAFSPQPEIFSYLRHVREPLRHPAAHPLRPRRARTAPGTKPRSAGASRPRRGWSPPTSSSRAAGALSEPAVPKLPGLERFEGPAFHSARWDHGVDLTGESVAVVGTGASAIQFVPEIQPKVGKLNVFQRTPPWILPRRNRALSERDRSRSSARFRPCSSSLRGPDLRGDGALRTRLPPPGADAPAAALAVKYLESCVPDPVLRAKLTPNYTLGCKRILFSSQVPPQRSPRATSTSSPTASRRSAPARS